MPTAVEPCARNEFVIVGFLFRESTSCRTRFNDRLEASARGLSADVLQQLRNAFGDKVVIGEDAIRFRGLQAFFLRAAKAQQAVVVFFT